MIANFFKCLVYAIFGFVALFIGIALLAPERPMQPCEADWRKCSVNSDIVNQFSGMTTARVACRMAADKLARFGDPQWPTLYFHSYIPGGDGPETGRIILIEPDARFQNGFGAMAHTRVACHYDLRDERVLDVQISNN
jgi:hypothetical protein